MSCEENKKLLRQFTADFNSFKGDATKIRALYEKFLAPDFVGHNLLSGDINREKRIQSVIMAASVIPDLNYTEEDMIAEGDKIVTRYTARFTHTGLFMGIPPTGKQVTVRGMQINKIVDGKNIETWDFMDYMGLLAQLGVVPGSPTKK
jgi:predicted ester cyclase